ncbi:general secretion pathway protein GspK [Sphingobium sp. CAP-1]|uniref:general secretion pathway protein GspK n=1 Tax=Sphingobium sp. CAP-1 TaxID=2676077 RepID=UPI0012BB2EEF|nr:type II secretion system protein GspK [Sphingobium sp. CAP-1]QGP80470.1 hypothetical protein GL174_15155 [Sphingobium sp. CAP-1]
MPTFKPPPEEKGFALVAALIALALFAGIAFAMMATEKGNLAGTAAHNEQAHLAAAADAGVVIAAAHLSHQDMGASPWRIDGRPYRTDLNGITLTIRIEDERGKIRLNDLSEVQARLMFEGAGVGGRRLDELTDAFLDWTDADDESRPYGAEAADYARLGYQPRNGALRSVGELALIRGMDRAIYDRIAPAATVFFGGAGGFDPANAHPLAMAVMLETGMGSPDVIERQRAIAGQRTTLEQGAAPALAGRPLTIRVLAEDGQGGRLDRATIIEFPDATLKRWDIRYQP